MPTFKTNLKTSRQQLVRIPQSEVNRLLASATIIESLQQDENVRVELVNDWENTNNPGNADILDRIAQYLRRIPRVLSDYQVKRDGKATAPKTT